MNTENGKLDKEKRNETVKGVNKMTFDSNVQERNCGNTNYFIVEQKAAFNIIDFIVLLHCTFEFSIHPNAMWFVNHKIMF